MDTRFATATVCLYLIVLPSSEATPTLPTHLPCAISSMCFYLYVLPPQAHMVPQGTRASQSHSCLASTTLCFNCFSPLHTPPCFKLPRTSISCARILHMIFYCPGLTLHPNRPMRRAIHRSMIGLWIVLRIGLFRCLQEPIIGLWEE